MHNDNVTMGDLAMNEAHVNASEILRLRAEVRKLNDRLDEVYEWAENLTVTLNQYFDSVEYIG